MFIHIWVIRKYIKQKSRVRFAIVVVLFKIIITWSTLLFNIEEI